MIKLTLISLLGFCAIYSIKIALIPVTLGLILWPVCAVYLFWRRPSRFISQAVQGGAALPIIWVAFLAAYSVCISVLRGSGQDFSIAYNFVIWLILFIPSGFVLAISEQGDTRDGLWHGIDLQNMIVVIMALQSVCIYLSFFSPGFRDVVSVLLGDESGGTLDQFGTRVKGFSSSGGATLSLIQAVGAALSFKLFTERGKWKYLFFSVIIAGSTLFTGRTGLIFTALFLTMYLPYCIFSGKIRWRIVLTTAVITGLILPFLYNNYIEDDTKGLIEGSVLTRSFDIFEDIFSGEMRQHSTVAAVSNMYAMPDTAMRLIFGDGIYIDDGFDYAPDPGYVKYVYFFGFLGCLGLYGYFLLLMVITVSNCASTMDKVFVLIIYVLYFILETKEPFFGKTNIIHHILYFYSIQSAKVRRLLTVAVRD